MNRSHRNSSQLGSSGKKNLSSKNYEAANIKSQAKAYPLVNAKGGNNQLYRTSSRDNVKRIVEREGRTARNLLNWSVPVTDGSYKQEHGVGRSRRSSKSNPKSGHLPTNRAETGDGDSGRQPRSRSDGSRYRNEYRKVHGDGISHSEGKDGKEGEHTKILNIERATKSEAYQERVRQAIEYSSKDLTTPISRPSSASSMRKDNLRARYWTYLFDNLHRAVDELYSTCESDENIMECEEVLMILDGCRRDFTALIDRIKVFRQVENADKKNRPHSVAWEVRKMSPGKCASPPPLMFSGRRSPSPAQRALNFGTLPATAKSNAVTSSTLSSVVNGISWADRVRGFVLSSFKVKESIPNAEVEKESERESSTPRPPSVVAKSVVPSPIEEKSNEEESEGGVWEVVGKGRNRSKGSSVSVTSQTSSVSSPSQASLVGNGRSAFEKLDRIATAKCAIDTDHKIAEEGNRLTSTEAPESSNSTLMVKETKTYSAGATEPTAEQESATGSNNGAVGEQELSTGCETKDKRSEQEVSDEEYQNAFQEDDFSRELEEEQEKALASAIKEEAHLTRELEDEALKNTEDEDQEDLSSDREETVTEEEESEPLHDTADDLDASLSYQESSQSLTWEEILAQYEQEHREPYDWGDIIESTEPARPPGRALEMHQKLSSPSRKRPRAESVRISEERMVKAERRRLKLLEEKCYRLKSLSEKVRTVRELKNQLLNQKELLINQKMKKADEKRQLVLQEKVKKAQEEEAKVNEIAFINTLEAQNKKIEVQEKHQVQEARLQDIQEERQRKREEQLAKEEAAQERRKALEAVRKARLEEIRLKRTEQELKWEKERIEREKAREEAVRKKEKERESKLAARNEALQQAAEELQRKIEQKQLESTRRYEQQIEQVKEKAASSSRHSTVEEAPSAIPYEKKKKCTLCNKEIVSEVYLISHLRGKRHRDVVRDSNKKITDAEMDTFSMKYIREIDETEDAKIKEKENRLKAMKKRAKKIKARMALKGREYETTFAASLNSEDSSKKSRLHRGVKEINRLLQAHGQSLWPANKITALERSLREMERLLEAKNFGDQAKFCQVGGLAVLCRFLLLIDTSEKQNTKSSLPDKVFVLVTNTIGMACDGHRDNSLYMLLSNKLANLVDLIMYRISNKRKTENEDKINDKSKLDSDLCIPELESDTLVLSLLKILTQIIAMFPSCQNENVEDNVTPNLTQRISDVVSYIVCTGLVDRLHGVIRNIQGPLESPSSIECLSILLLFFETLITSMIKFEGIFGKRKEDPNPLMQVLEATELGGIVSLTYALLHQGGSTRISPSPIPLSENTINAIGIILRCLNYIAVLDLNLFQSSVGAEGVSLQYRSVASYLLRYCSHQKCDDVLHELILSIGYFAVLNEENQGTIQSGRAPTLLQQLCTLPFAYFSDPRLKMVLLPTLISCCMGNKENKEIVEQEVSCELFASFLEENIARNTTPVVKLNMQWNKTAMLQFRSSLEFRFPLSSWVQAKENFISKPQVSN